jgi:asparagine synthase (glutamine-hydrolysing)
MIIGFCIESNGEAVQLRLSGRRSSNGLLLFRRESRLAVVFLGRLHYRADLRARLGLRERECERLDDAGLVLEAYRRRGTQGLAQLEGTFALAVWDADAGELIARRDLMGGYPLYWAREAGRTALGTSLDLVRGGRTDELDPDYLATYQMLTCFAENEPEQEATAYRGVRRVQPGYLARIEVRSGRVTTQRIWDWLERLEDPGTDDISQIGRGYLERLRGAVRESIHGTTVAHLSGGMDSTSVALMAFDAIEHGAGPGPLHTISLVYDRMRVLAREKALIEDLVRSRGGWEPHLIQADDLLNFDRFEDPPAHEEPWPWLSTAEVELARVEVARRIGAATVLTGQGADELLDTGPHHITDHFRSGRLRRAWGETCRCARDENCSVWTILGPYGVLNLLPAWARDGLGPLWRSGYAPWPSMGETTVPPWIRSSFASCHGLRERAIAQVRATYDHCRPTVLSVALARVRARAGDLGRSYLSTPRGILVEHPFLDPRVICYNLGIHARMDPLPRTTPKPILGEAMRGTLPEEIRTRPKAGFFNEPYFRGIARHLGYLERLVTSAPRAVDDWIDRGTLIECLRKSALGIGHRRIQMDRLNLTLSYLRWLLMRESHSDTSDHPDELVELAATVTKGEHARVLSRP